MPTDLKKIKPLDDQAEFVMSFVDDSREERDQFEEIWEETENNFLVRTLGDRRLNTTRYPLLDKLGDFGHGSTNRSGYTELKDPETHQAVMTVAAKVVLGVMGEPGYIKATKVGDEDLFAAMVTSKLLEYGLRLEGHFLQMVEWVMRTGIYGTGLIECGWHYKEEPRTFRNVRVDPFTGESQSSSEILIAPVYDDPRISVVDNRDFFPDRSETMLSRMLGVAKRFRITERDALRRGEDGIYNKANIKRAVEGGESTTGTDEDRDHPDDPTSGKQTKKAHHAFGQMEAFEYYGEVPFKTDDDIDRRVVTVVNGVTVRSKPWPRRLPFFDLKFTPRPGSFWGIGAAEVMRHDQDLADTLKMMIADAVVRSTHPPNIYNRQMGQDLARKLRTFRPNIPIGVDGNPAAAVAQVPYNPPVQPAFQFYSGIKGQMREGPGTLGAVQGLGLGSKRFSATEAQGTFQEAQNRPELGAVILEREPLPALGAFMLSLNQEFLEDGTDDLQRRVGQTSYPVALADILGDFDLEYTGSRQEGSKAEKLAAFREIVAASANPIVAQLTPWIPLLKKWFEGAGAPEIAAMVGNEQMTQLYIALHQLGGNQAQGNGNGEAAGSAPPVGQLPAQGFGGAQ